MKKIGFLMSFVLVGIGCICLYLTIILDNTIPVLGKMASQLSDSKHYGELMYSTNYIMAYFFCILLIVIGTILSIFFYRREYK